MQQWAWFIRVMNKIDTVACLVISWWCFRSTCKKRRLSLLVIGLAAVSPPARLHCWLVVKDSRRKWFNDTIKFNESSENHCYWHWLSYQNTLLPLLTVGLLCVRLTPPTSRILSRACRHFLLLSPAELRTLVWSPAVKWVVKLQATSHGLSHLLRGNPNIIELLQLRNILQNCPPIKIGVALSTWIFLQPEVLKSG